MTEKIDCAVIGAGVVGLAIARELALAGREVMILEAEAAIGTHASSRNSEVIHAGIYYATGSLKAQMCVAGRKALYQYCADANVNYRRIGKVIVATDATELAALGKHREQAQINGVNDLRMLSRTELNQLEPEVAGVAGVLSPSTGIIDSHALMLAYLGDAENRGASLVLNSPVTGGRVSGEGIVLEVGGADPVRVLCKSVVNAAGLNAQAVARTIVGVPPQTIPATYYAIGHYYTLTARTPFNRLVYPIARGDWLGVHATIDLGGRCKFGPDFEWRDSIDYAFDDHRREAFYPAIRRFYPALKDGGLQPGYTGIRAKIAGPHDPPADFAIQGPQDHGIAGMIALYGIDSPGLTSSLAIAAHVAQLLDGTR